MKKAVLVKQHDITDCGAACLTSVAAHFGLKMPLARVRQYAGTDKKGTNVLGILEAAQKLGFTAKGVKGVFDSLFKIPLPAIAHVVVKEQLQHFVVIYRVDKQHITIMDPGDGKIHRKKHDEFIKEWTSVLVLLVPAETFKKDDQQTPVVRRFIQLVRPHKTVMAQAFFGAIVYSILGLATSVYVQKIVDYVLVDGNINLLNLMSMVMLFILLLRTFIGSMKSILALKTGQKIDATLLLGYYKHLLTLPQQFFDTMRVGEIISRVNDAVKIRSFINNVSLTLAVNILMVLCTMGLMFIYSWKLTLVVACSIPLFFALYFVLNRFNKKYMRRIMEDSAELESQLVESVTSVATIKRFGVEDYANVKTETRFVKLLRSTFSGAKGFIFSGNTSELISGLVTIAVLWAGSYWAVGQDFTPGTLMSFYALTGYLLSPVLGIINANQSVQDALIAADRLFQIMDIEQEEVQENKMSLTKDMLGDISFQSVNFRYGTRKQVFENLDLLIPARQTTAIVGESGSGKTTLMALLQNIYPIQQGNIRIGSHNLQHVSNESLRRLVATVPQQVDLFAGTVLQNIALDDWQPDVRKVTEICAMLGIAEMIDQLPAGLSTYVGEHGVSLSGGERQRIAIARALYKDPEILILDEATSALDSASERFVKHALNRLSEQGKTIVVIAHRLSTIRDAHKIVVLHEGKVVEEGIHHELIARNGYYLNYWNIQTANH